MVASTADAVTFSLLGVVVVIGLIVIWRVVIHDRTIRKVRFGVFWERERDPEERP
jgi:hypothetical protein